jgi:hypothetical protein
MFQPKTNNELVTVLMHSNRLIIFLAAETWIVHVLHARDQPGRREEGEECYLEWRCSSSWAHGGVVVAAAGCGGRRCFSFFSPMLRRAVCFLCFSFPLSTVSLPLCRDFVAVRLVLAVPLVEEKRRTGRGTRRTLLRILCIFFFYLLPSAGASFLRSLYSLSFSLSLSFFSLPLCSPISVFFFSVLFSPSLSRLFSPLSTLVPLLFFPSPVFGSSSGFYSQRTQAFFW